MSDRKGVPRGGGSVERWLRPVAALAGMVAMLFAPATSAEVTDVLVAYDFEQPAPSGPDTFRVFEQSGGAIDLSREFRVGGRRSLRIREGWADGCFSEFLGRFPEQRAGVVHVQFALLLTDPEETLNVALAGPRWFLHYGRDGHAFWLDTHRGSFRHRPGGSVRELFAPRAFTWYFFEIAYDVDRGRYDLTIFEEGSEAPVVALRDQRNVANADRSSIAYYSFIGDLEDDGQATYFVDDLWVTTGQRQRLKPFVAPGRRELFVTRLALDGPLFEAEEWSRVAADAEVALRHLASEPAGATPVEHLERVADAAFVRGDLELAGAIYSALADRPGASERPLLKLADVHFLRGDLARERQARERVYGRLVDPAAPP